MLTQDISKDKPKTDHDYRLAKCSKNNPLLFLVFFFFFVSVEGMIYKQVLLRCECFNFSCIFKSLWFTVLFFGQFLLQSLNLSLLDQRPPEQH